MGTNYYWRHNQCDCCGRYDELHIGKSSGGLQGHFDEDGQPLITSWTEWRDRIRSGGQVWNEYDAQEDVEKFIAWMESRPREERRRQYDWVRDHAPPWYGAGRPPLGEVGPGGTWLDADGFSFYGGEFT